MSDINVPRMEKVGRCPKGGWVNQIHCVRLGSLISIIASKTPAAQRTNQTKHLLNDGRKTLPPRKGVSV
jgi:hypothetical protein